MSLNVGFDGAYPDFGASNTPLGNMVVVDNKSACYGMTVQEVLDAANCVLSGATDCGFDASSINECATSIDEAFVDGTGNTGYVCDPPQ